MARNVVVLGSTGSIGRQTLDVARDFPDRVRVYGLSGGTNRALMRQQTEEFHPTTVIMGGDESRDRVAREMVDLVTRDEVDIVVVGTSGTVGLFPAVEALRAGKLVALANKEALVMAGPIVREVVSQGRGTLVPIDSEHSAIWQCLQGEPSRSLARITLTASGGALRDLDAHEIEKVTPERVLRHPTWVMGRKITVDSATLMNKGLEVLEARWLFDVPLDRIDVVLHPQSIVHSLVTFDDSSTKAQLGLPDMRLPIQYALSHPERWSNDLPRLDLTTVGALTFAPIDLERYPALGVALDAGRAGGTAPASLVGADEVAVGAFLDGRIDFTEIPRLVRRVVEDHKHCQFPDLTDILAAEQWARDRASRLVSEREKV